MRQEGQAGRAGSVVFDARGDIGRGLRLRVGVSFRLGDAREDRVRPEARSLQGPVLVAADVVEAEGCQTGRCAGGGARRARRPRVPLPLAGVEGDMLEARAGQVDAG